MKSYLEFINEGIFDRFKKPKKRKLVLPSDSDMGELIDQIKGTFDPKKLSWGTALHEEYWVYKSNDVDIRLIHYTTSLYGATIKLDINKKSVAVELISYSILKELLDFFKEKEKEIKLSMNSELFNKTIKSRTEAEKYNL